MVQKYIVKSYELKFFDNIINQENKKYQKILKNAKFLEILNFINYYFCILN